METARNSEKPCQCQAAAWTNWWMLPTETPSTVMVQIGMAPHVDRLNQRGLAGLMDRSHSPRRPLWCTAVFSTRKAIPLADFCMSIATAEPPGHNVFRRWRLWITRRLRGHPSPIDQFEPTVTHVRAACAAPTGGPYFGTYGSITLHNCDHRNTCSIARQDGFAPVFTGTAQCLHCAMCAAAMARVCCFMLESMQAACKRGT